MLAPRHPSHRRHPACCTAPRSRTWHWNTRHTADPGPSTGSPRPRPWPPSWPARASSARPRHRATPGPAAASGPRATAPDAHAATYPLDCKGAAQTVTDTAEGDLDGDGRPETVAAVRCDAGSGTPPHAIYVLTLDKETGATPASSPPSSTPMRRQTATELTVSDGTVTARLLGYSSPSVPRYSPDVKQLAKWRWTGGKFRQELTDSAATRV